MFKRQTSGQRHQISINTSQLKRGFKRKVSVPKQVHGYYFIGYHNNTSQKPKVVMYRSFKKPLDSTILKKCDHKKGKLLEYVSASNVQEPLHDTLQIIQHKWINYLNNMSFELCKDIRK